MNTFTDQLSVALFDAITLKYNENHDEQGRFSSGDGGSSGSDSGGDNSQKFGDDMAKTIATYEPSATKSGDIRVSPAKITDAGFYSVVVNSTSQTISRRVESKIQRRLSHGGFAKLNHFSPTSFQIVADKTSVDKLYGAK